MKTHVFRKFLICFVLWATIATFDYLTGYEITSYPLYLMPICLTFFYFGKVGGYVACGVAISIWTEIDIATGHQFSHEIMRYWGSFARLVIYVIFVYGLSVYVDTVSVHRRRLEQMRRLVSMCHGCGRILWEDGTWKTPEEVFKLAEIHIPECPSCTASNTRQSQP